MLTVSSNGRYIQRNGTPFLGHGYVAWSLITELQQSDMIYFLDDMQSKGITSLIVEAIEYDTAPLSNFYGDLPFTGSLGGGNLDFTTPNSAWWNLVDFFIDACADRFIVPWILPAYYGFIPSLEGWGVAGQLAANGTTRLNTYGQFLGNRYASYDIVWVHFGDGLPDATGRGLVKAIADGIRATAPGHLHSNHYARPSLSTDNIEVVPDINWAYSRGAGFAPYVHKVVLDGYAYTPTQPVYLGEDYYQNRNASPIVTAQQQRQNSWDTWFSGGKARFLGDEFVWSFNRPTTMNPAPVQNWYDHLNDIGTLQYAPVRQFLIEREWWLLDASTGTGLVTAGGGTVDTAAYKPRGLASDGSYGCVYVSDGTSVTVNTSLVNGGVNRKRWYDPTNGTYQAATGQGGGVFVASSEVGNNAGGGTDWVLAIDAINPVQVPAFGFWVS